MNYLRDTQKKVQETITYTENVSIMTENFIGANTVRKLIEEKIKSNTSISFKSDYWSREPGRDQYPRFESSFLQNSYGILTRTKK